MKFCFDEEAMEAALRANGWDTLWHNNNWVYNFNENPDPDHAGVSLKQAFAILMHENNLAPANPRYYWIEE